MNNNNHDLMPDVWLEIEMAEVWVFDLKFTEKLPMIIVATIKKHMNSNCVILIRNN